jgi:hypothetical protein
MNEYLYEIIAKWRVEPTASVVMGEKFLRALELIAAAAPEVGVWKIARAPGQKYTLSIDEARKILPSLMIVNVATDDWGDPDPDYGYRLFAGTRNDMSPKGIRLSAAAGGRFADRISFRVGSHIAPSDLAVVSYRLFRAALLAIIGQWPSVWANAYLYRSDDRNLPRPPDIPLHPDSKFHIPWLSYLSAPLAKRLRPPADIVSERTPDGGSLMIATEERFDPTNPEHMRRSREIAQIMIARIPLNPWEKVDPAEAAGPRPSLFRKPH